MLRELCSRHSFHIFLQHDSNRTHRLMHPVLIRHIWESYATSPTNSLLSFFTSFIEETKPHIMLSGRGPQPTKGYQVGKLTGGGRDQTSNLHLKTLRLWSVDQGRRSTMLTGAIHTYEPGQRMTGTPFGP